MSALRAAICSAEGAGPGKFTESSYMYTSDTPCGYLFVPSNGWPMPTLIISRRQQFGAA